MTKRKLPSVFFAVFFLQMSSKYYFLFFIICKIISAPRAFSITPRGAIEGHFCVKDRTQFDNFKSYLITDKRGAGNI